MRKSLCLFLALGLMYPVGMSFPCPPEDLGGSGYELDSSGCGSEDWSQPGEMKKDHPDSKDVPVITANSGMKNNFHESLVLNFDKAGGSGFLSFLERKDVFAAVIAGGVVGVVLAVALTALLIYTWQKKDNGGYIQGQQRASDRDYHRPNREEVIV